MCSRYSWIFVNILMHAKLCIHVVPGFVVYNHFPERASKKLKSGQNTESLNGVVTSAAIESPATLTAARRSKVSRRIPHSDFMAVTGFDGQRVYVTMKTEFFVQHQVISALFLILRKLLSKQTEVLNKGLYFVIWNLARAR